MLAITDARILTVSAGIIPSGAIIIRDGRIAEVGRNVRVPEGAATIDGRGMWVTPGFIDAHSHLGMYSEPMTPATMDGNEMTDPVTPQVRALDSFNPGDPGIAEVLGSGVTAVYTMPGSANVIGGTGIMVKLRGRTVEDMMVPGVQHMKMALGENPKQAYGQRKKTAPATRMGTAAVLRAALVSAHNYLQGQNRNSNHRPERDLGMEALAKTLTGQMKVRIHCHRSDDILTAIRVAEEFKLDYALEHVTEGYRIADILADKEAVCVVGPMHAFRTKMELQGLSLRNPGILARAGVKVCIQVDGKSNTWWLPIHAGVAVREGMPEADAFRAITLHPAQLLGVDDRMGSIEVGKDADLSVFDGHPFHTYTRCEKVIIEGKIVFDRSQEP